jgi:hypothetical protein
VGSGFHCLRFFSLFFAFKAHSLQLRSFILVGVVDAYDQGGLGYADGNDKQVLFGRWAEGGAATY